jgi:hypothetical protein
LLIGDFLSKWRSRLKLRWEGSTNRSPPLRICVKLIDALFEERIGEAAAAGQSALSASDPRQGLVGFLQRANALQARDRGLKQALLSARE